MMRILGATLAVACTFAPPARAGWVLVEYSPPMGGEGVCESQGNAELSTSAGSEVSYVNGHAGPRTWGGVSCAQSQAKGSLKFAFRWEDSLHPTAFCCAEGAGVAEGKWLAIKYPYSLEYTARATVKCSIWDGDLEVEVEGQGPSSGGGVGLYQAHVVSVGGGWPTHRGLGGGDHQDDQDAKQKDTYAAYFSIQWEARASGTVWVEGCGKVKHIDADARTHTVWGLGGPCED